MTTRIQELRDKVQNDLARWGGQILTVEDEPGLWRFRLYTDRHCYAVTAREPSAEKLNGYLGCTVSTRKPRAGEDWTRGNDLLDGQFSEETWRGIMADIIAFEMVQVDKSGRRIVTKEQLDQEQQARPVDCVAGPPIGVVKDPA